MWSEIAAHLSKLEADESCPPTVECVPPKATKVWAFDEELSHSVTSLVYVTK